MELLVDKYTRKARLTPLLLTVLPVPLAVLVLAPVESIGWHIFWPLIVWCGGVLLLSELGRDMGKKKEDQLYALWGGKPTTRKLRHSGNANPIQLKQQHDHLARVVPDVEIPTAEQEVTDPARADSVYDLLTAKLRDLTRDRSRFPLVYAELCSYGFRRNLWGLKPVGLACTLICVALVLLGAARYVDDLTQLPVDYIVVLLILVLLLLLWIFRITPNWVNIPAEAYADRLLEAIPRVADGK